MKFMGHYQHTEEGLVSDGREIFYMRIFPDALA